MKDLLKNKYALIFVATVFLLLGFYLSKIIDLNNQRSPCVTKLKLLKPSLDCDSYDDKVQKLSALESKISLIVEGYKKTGKIKRMSVFVRDLNTSRFAGVNDEQTYYMASLLKTPLVIGGFKLAEVEPRILEQTITYTGEPNLYTEQVVKSDEYLKPGETYSIRELMRRTIVYSDNTAAQLLYAYFPNDFLSKIMQALGIQIKKPDGDLENLITARTYANLFRVLYNSSYLTKEYSNETLEFLTQTTFNNGATLKLPKDVQVAHKFGERTLVYTDGSVAVKQFHECGIVYAEKGSDSYIFCILTEGAKYEDLESVISDTSLLIYEEMVNE